MKPKEPKRVYTISDLITVLEFSQALHGDIPVKIYDYGELNDYDEIVEVTIDKKDDKMFVGIK